MARKQIPAINALELDDEKPVSRQRVWISEHKSLIFIVVIALLLAGIFGGIRFYKNASHPLTKFRKATAKDFNSSFSFELEAQKDGKTVMKYSGAYEAEPAKQNLSILYDADYGDYTYTGAVYAEGGSAISGNLYNGEWNIRDCTDKVLNFFDFHTDFKAGRFDAASFLRFTGLASSYSAEELGSFIKTLKQRMDGSNALASVDVTAEDGSKTYTYQIDVQEFFDLVRDKGASIFFSSIDYDAFCELYEKNTAYVKDSDCTFRFTVNSSGYLSELDFSLKVGAEEFAVHCTMDDFGEAEADIPEAFFEAEKAEK